MCSPQRATLSDTHGRAAGTCWTTESSPTTSRASAYRSLTVKRAGTSGGIIRRERWPQRHNRASGWTVGAAGFAARRPRSEQAIGIGLCLQRSNGTNPAASSPDLQPFRRLWVALAKSSDPPPDQSGFASEHQDAGREQRRPERHRQRKQDRADDDEKPARDYGECPPHVVLSFRRVRSKRNPVRLSSYWSVRTRRLKLSFRESSATADTVPICGDALCASKEHKFRLDGRLSSRRRRTKAVSPGSRQANRLARSPNPGNRTLLLRATAILFCPLVERHYSPSASRPGN